MRKLIVLSTLALSGLAVVPSAQAQQNMVGIKGGLIVSDLSATEEQELEGTKSKTGFGFGAFLQVQIAGALSVQPEALYLNKGVKGDTGSGELELSYIQVPILVQYHISTASGLSPRVYLGPTIAFETGCEISGFDIEGGEAEANCERVDVDTKSADFGLVFGAGVDVPAGRFVVTGDARYDLGVTNLDDSGADGSVKNRAWEFFLGVGLPIGR
ncbi:MAG: porin family protein [Gemmatimonadota bacterium]